MTYLGTKISTDVDIPSLLHFYPLPSPSFSHLPTLNSNTANQLQTFFFFFLAFLLLTDVCNKACKGKEETILNENSILLLQYE